MTAEKVLRITKEEKEVIKSLYVAAADFVYEEASAEVFASTLNDIVECIYYNQSVTDEYDIAIITEGEENKK